MTQWLPLYELSLANVQQARTIYQTILQTNPRNRYAAQNLKLFWLPATDPRPSPSPVRPIREIGRVKR